ncbi:MAG: ParB/RepB/Spo0J family partition protein [Vicinamibacterales bacterium]
MSTAAAVSPLSVGYHEIPLADLHPSPLNPRRRPTGIEDLAASIAEVGLLEPMLVRPLPAARGFEVIAGGRRLEAARRAGLMLAPCLVRELDDAHALELAIIENNQRGDIHPLDEAHAFEQLQQLDRAYTVEALAAKIGRPVAYVRTRLRLLDLDEEVRTAFAEDRLTIGHADRIARLPRPLQARAFEEGCFDPLFGADGDAENLLPIARLDEWIARHQVIDVRDPAVQEALPELVARVDRLEAEGATLVQLDTSPRPEHGLKGKAAPLPRSKWVEVAGAPCAHAVQGVVVYGERQRADVLTVCLKRSKCLTHWPERTPGTASDAGPRPKQPWEIENERRAAARQELDAVSDELLTAIARHLKGRKVDLAYANAIITAPTERAEIAKFVGKLTPATLGAALWFHEVQNLGTFDPDRWKRDVKALVGFDVTKWLQARKKAQAKSGAATGAKAKPARKATAAAKTAKKARTR